MYTATVRASDKNLDTRSHRISAFSISKVVLEGSSAGSAGSARSKLGGGADGFLGLKVTLFIGSVADVFESVCCSHSFFFKSIMSNLENFSFKQDRQVAIKCLCSKDRVKAAFCDQLAPSCTFWTKDFNKWPTFWKVGGCKKDQTSKSRDWWHVIDTWEPSYKSDFQQRNRKQVSECSSPLCFLWLCVFLVPGMHPQKRAYCMYLILHVNSVSFAQQSFCLCLSTGRCFPHGERQHHQRLIIRSWDATILWLFYSQRIHLWCQVTLDDTKVFGALNEQMGGEGG